MARPRPDFISAAFFGVLGCVAPACLAQDTPLGGLSSRPAAAPPQTISIFFVDRVEENGNVWPFERWTELTNESWVAQQLDELIQEKHPEYEVIVNDQTEVLRKIYHEYARLTTADYGLMHDIATRQGAQYFIVGYSHVIGPQPDDRLIPGRTTYVWDAFAKARMFRTDTGKQIATLDQKALAENVNPDAGRIDALRRVGSLLAPKLLDQIQRRQSAEAGGGRSVTVSVEGADLTLGAQLKKVFESVAAGAPVVVQYGPRTMTARFMHRAPADEIAAQIFARLPTGLKADLLEARDDAIRLRIKGE